MPSVAGVRPVARKKNKITNFRFSDEALLMLDELARFHGQSRTAFLEQLLRSQYRRQFKRSGPGKKPENEPETP